MGGSRYTAKDITVLEGLEPVRKRPGMYIGGVDRTGLHHLLWELLDNSVDEAMNGHCDKILVRLHKDGKTVTVTDNGRGIPVDKHPKHKKSALELILTTLHAGGKFENRNYFHAGGLHGVGASVVTALSSSMTARIKRSGFHWEQSFSRGVAKNAIKKAGPARGTGTSITFTPDSQIFPKTDFEVAVIRERMESRSYLHRGLSLTFQNDVDGTTEEFKHDNGISEWIDKIVAQRELVRLGDACSIERKNGIEIELALVWTESTDETTLSFVNGIPTRSGGAHENGLRAGIAKAVRNYLSVQNLTPKGLNIVADDIREGIVAILSIYIQEPQFQGQTKDRLNNPEVAAPIDNFVRTGLENYLLHNQTQAATIAERVVLAARARTASRAAAQSVQRKSAISHRLNLPGKLADCSSTNPEISELFLVEGDSAGGSAKQARDRNFQAILPLRGKVLNTEQASLAKVLANRELADIISALGCGAGNNCDLAKLRYHKLCLLMDADSDGHHICTLLLTFFYRHMRPLMDAGHVYIAQPPLYKIELGKQVHWALDEVERDAILAGAKAGKGGSGAKPGKNPVIQRFKGLGEMNPPTLKETTLDPAKRHLLRVSVNDETDTDRTMKTLMGRDVEPRFKFIMDHAASAEDLDI